MTLGDVIRKLTGAAGKTATALGTALVLAAPGCGEDTLRGSEAQEASEACNPAAECDEPGCMLYDDFNESELDVKCRWSDLTYAVGKGTADSGWWTLPVITNGTAQLGEGSVLEALHTIVARSGRCEQFPKYEFFSEDFSEFDYIFEYQARFQRGAEQQGHAIVGFALTEIYYGLFQMYHPSDPRREEFPLSGRCIGVDKLKTPLLGVDITQWNKYRIEKTGTVATITINHEEKARFEEEGCKTRYATAPKPEFFVLNTREAANDPKGTQRLDLDYVKVICK